MCEVGVVAITVNEIVGMLTTAYDELAVDPQFPLRLADAVGAEPGSVEIVCADVYNLHENTVFLEIWDYVFRGLPDRVLGNERSPEIDSCRLIESMAAHWKLVSIKFIAESGFQVEGELEGCLHAGIVELFGY